MTSPTSGIPGSTSSSSKAACAPGSGNGDEPWSIGWRRSDQAVLIAATLGLSWLGMQIVHELGHVLLAWASGETVDRVVLHPLVISRTDVSHARHPLLVAWGGPVLG